jgi:hypothetical protein
MILTSSISRFFYIIGKYKFFDKGLCLAPAPSPSRLNNPERIKGNICLSGLNGAFAPIVIPISYKAMNVFFRKAQILTFLEKQ